MEIQKGPEVNNLQASELSCALHQNTSEACPWGKQLPSWCLQMVLQPSHFQKYQPVAWASNSPLCKPRFVCTMLASFLHIDSWLSSDPWLSSGVFYFSPPCLMQPHFKPRKIQWSPSTMMKNNLEAMGFGINWPLPQLYMTQTGSCLWTCLYKSKPWVWPAVPIPIQQTPVVTNCTMEVWIVLFNSISYFLKFLYTFTILIQTLFDNKVCRINWVDEMFSTMCECLRVDQQGWLRQACASHACLHHTKHILPIATLTEPFG